MAEALRFEQVTKFYGTEAGAVEVLRGISFSLDTGEAMAVTGPSGSGKSTLLHLAATLETPTSGSIRIGGEAAHDLPERELAAFRSRRVGLVFQDHYLLPQYTMLQNVLLPTVAAGNGENDAEGRARALLERVGLGARVDHRPAQLSGGERQRAAIVRAVINRPSLLLCDEPTGNLDGETAGSVADLLLELHGDEESALIVVTHSLELAARLPRRVELRAGLIRELPPAQATGG
ncbi:MAG: ABC transporter ATP-binding protein [Acidobacteriota bacterium]|nr:ABC transporter ATP-binding protein [Acidobacteriota bacterium]